MTNINIDENRFTTMTIYTEEGESIRITKFGKDYETDIGTVSMINKHGLGGNEWIRSMKDVEKHVKQINQVIWIDQNQKKELIQFITTW